MRHVLCTLLIASGLARAADPVAASLDAGVKFFEARLKNDPEDFIAANHLVDRLLRRERWRGQLADLRRAGEVAALSLEVLPAEQNAGGLAGGAQVALAMHRFDEARTDAGQLEQATPGKPATQQLLASAQLELSDLDGAERALQEMVRRGGDGVGSEFGFSRLAWLRGQLAEARRHLDAAVDAAREATPPAPEVLVWCLVQRGEHRFRRGDWEAAEMDYGEAFGLAPQQWNVLDHLGELRAAQGRDAEAVELFTQVATATDRAEIWQALGDWHLFMKRPAEAKAAHDKALAGYRASLDRGEILYVHHLAGFYSDSQEDAAEAVKWARRDLEQRHGAPAWDALAWALYKQGDLPAALDAAKKVVASGIADSHLLYHAGVIHLSAGEIATGQALLKRCPEVNPHFNAFHSHR